ncbi:MAG TPA: papain-like cysteine protease family protein [Terriglobales bacterium]
MKKILLLVLLVILALMLSGCCKPLKVGALPVNWMAPQHTDTWCWAASTEMVSDYYAHRVNQCDSSKFVHNNPADCSKGCPGYCSCWGVCGATIGQIENNWTHWNFKYLHTSAALSWAELEQTLSLQPKCDRSPVQVIWWWTGFGGHVVTAYGYADTPMGKLVYYYNPWPPDCTTPNSACNSSPTTGGDDAVATYEWMVSTPDKQWGDSFSKFSYAGK